VSLKKWFRNALKTILPRQVFSKIENFSLEYGPAYYVPSYSQEGEDVILRSLFPGQKEGFYVDVGAHHPRRFSNTYIFYRMGWRGINIEPDPAGSALLTKHRKRDVNLQLGIGPEKGIMEYYQFDEPALNTFDKILADERVQSGNCHLIRTTKVPVESLAVVLNRYLKGRKIDFLNVDVEGMDLMVLNSNDWDRYRPTVVLVEMPGDNVRDSLGSDIFDFLSEKGYEILAKTQRTGIFRDRSVRDTN
jgi:FkbM family methyltransferase